MRPRWGTVRKVHFIGIGGVGMCALAEVLLDDGVDVSGCDSAESDRTRRLAVRGATITIGHHPSHVEDIDAVVVSAAVAPEHPELEAARLRGIPVVRRAALVDEVIRGLQSVAVAGTHGKTTTSALLSHILDHAGSRPTTVVGGLIRGMDGYGRRGPGSIAVCEADEFDRAFLELNPLIAVITNVEEDHLDCYESEEALHAAFEQFASRPPFHGAVLLCGDDPGSASLAQKARAPVVTYGLNPGNTLMAADIDFDGVTSSFTVFRAGEVLGRVHLNLTGNHNVRNALAAIGAGMELGLEFKQLSRGCTDFDGVGRRFELIGEHRGVVVIDDYAHHPTEIEAVLAAARDAFPERRIIAVFQPHLFSRTRDFAGEFGHALSGASLAIVLPVFPAREAPIPGVTHEIVLSAITGRGTRAIDGESIDRAGAILDRVLQDGDVVITMGAGDVDRVGRSWLEAAS